MQIIGVRGPTMITTRRANHHNIKGRTCQLRISQRKLHIRFHNSKRRLVDHCDHQPIQSNIYKDSIFFKDEKVKTVFHMLDKSKKLNLHKPKHSRKVGQTKDSKDQLFHQILKHSIKNCFILKNKMVNLVLSQ